MSLEPELTYFGAHKAELLQHHAGQFALIKGAELAGTYTTFGEAFDAGVAKFGNVSFLIKPVTAIESEAQLPALYAGILSAHT